MIVRRVLLCSLVLGSALSFHLLTPTGSHALDAHVFSLRFGAEVNETKVKERSEGKTVTEAEENVCDAASGDTCVEGKEGEGAGQLGEPTSVAISEATGDIYVTDSENGRVQVFAPDGAFVLMFGQGVNATTGTNICTQAEIETEQVTCHGGAWGSSPGQFYQPSGIAVDNSGDARNGDVLVAEEHNRRVQVFTAQGAFIEDITGPETPSGEFGDLSAVALSPTTGDLFVADGNREFIEAFAYNAATQKYEYIDGSVIQNAQTEFPLSLAIDGLGSLYVQNNYELRVARLNGAGTFQYKLSASNILGVAANTTSNDVYVSSDSGSVTEFDPSGTKILEFGAATITGGENTIAVNSTDDDVYVSERSNQDVIVFTPSSEVPAVTTGKATDIAEATATLTGAIEPFGLASSYYFQYGPTQKYGSVAPATPASAGSTGEAVSEEISGLAPNTTYYYRLVGEAGFEPKYGEQAHFTTLGHAPSITVGSAANIAQTSSSVAGRVNPEGAATTFYFTYVQAADCTGGIADYGGAGCTVATVPNSAGTAGSGVTPVPVSATLSNLQPNSAYYYDLTANNGRSVTGDAHEFATLPLAPTAVTVGAAGQGDMRAVLYGAIDAHHAATTSYHFQYGPTTTYGLESPEATLSESSDIEDVAFEPSELAPDSTYHYRIVATSAGGTTYGADETFTTTAPESYAPAPTATTGGAGNVLASAATLAGTVNSGGEETEYRFEYGTTVYYGAVAPAGGEVGAGASSQTVSATLTTLQPDTTYHYRLVANNAGGVAYGEDMTFTTAPAPAPVARPLSIRSVGSPARVAPAKKVMPLTRAERLARALNTCRKAAKKLRARCDTKARKKYRAKSKREVKPKNGRDR